MAFSKHRSREVLVYLTLAHTLVLRQLTRSVSSILRTANVTTQQDLLDLCQANAANYRETTTVTTTTYLTTTKR